MSKDTHNALRELPPHQRFNTLCEGDTLERFAWFEIIPCRMDESEGGVVQCEAGWAEFWGLYGRAIEGTEDKPEYLATAVHDATTALEAVRIARQIALETGKGFVAGDVQFGQYPRRHGRVTPVAEFTELAEDLTFAIHEDNEARIAPEDAASMTLTTTRWLSCERPLSSIRIIPAAINATLTRRPQNEAHNLYTGNGRR